MKISLVSNQTVDQLEDIQSDSYYFQFDDTYQNDILNELTLTNDEVVVAICGDDMKALFNYPSPSN